MNSVNSLENMFQKKRCNWDAKRTLSLSRPSVERVALLLIKRFFNYPLISVSRVLGVLA